MEGSNPFRGLLQSVLADVLQPVQPERSPAADTAEAGAAQEPADGGCTFEEQLQQQAAAVEDPYDARVAVIKQRFTAEAAIAAQARQLLQEAQQRAQQQEAEVLSAADAAYTPAWRQTGLPAKPLRSGSGNVRLLSEAELLDPAAIMAQQHAHQQKEVLQPAAVFEYSNQEADPHYLHATGNLKVRQTIASAWIAAVKTRKLEGQQQHEQQQASAATGSSTSGSNKTQLSGPHVSMGTNRAAKQQFRSVPWSQLPPEEVAAKVAAANNRHRAMSAIMTPQQREIEERIIKGMYHKLSFLRNPRYPSRAPLAITLPNGLKGKSDAHKHPQQQKAITDSSSKSSSPSRAKGSTAAALGTGPKSSVILDSEGIISGTFHSPQAVGLAVVPAEGIVFDDYQPGRVYSRTLQLQNIANVIKGLRLLPPASKSHYQGFL
eukprot:GHRR01028601.1.p1 GENE.GHRR01028601.1~~GHRR01028601.1.p1  ORF type:complete len:433 (+),score=169.13 GHRR01028601.1:372-1670(+)